MTRTKYISGCAECPYQGYAKGAVCRHPDASSGGERALPQVQPPPAWCPLRTTPVLLRVGTDGEGDE